MKLFALPVLVLSVLFVHAGAETDYFRPVVNDVAFVGEYVSFGEAKPKFRPVHQEQPVYPAELLERRIEGFAVVAFLVELDGTTSQCQVAKASDVAFGEAAREAISKWKFTAPEFAGKRGPIAMRLPVDFTLAPEAAGPAPAANGDKVAAR
jgi:TonB family protein